MAKSRTSGTETYNAPQPVVVYPNTPRQFHVERLGVNNEPMASKMPRVVGGVCEYCGILDGNVPSEFQYKLCPHYRGIDLRCSYCDATKNPDDVNYHSELNIKEYPINSGSLVVCCNSYECSKKHEERFKISR